MEIKIQKLKSNNTSSNIKKYKKFNHEQKAYIIKNNNNISNTNFNIIINKNTVNSKFLKLSQSNNIFSNEKEKNTKNKAQQNDSKNNNNKLILGVYAEKSKEKVRQNSYNGLMKTEETHLSKKNISINKRSFLNKINNFSPFNSKNKKDISINNENINNNIQKNKNEPQNIENNNNKKNQFTSLIKVTGKFKRTFSGYGMRRKSSMNKKNTSNNKNFNLTINKKSKAYNSQTKKKEQITTYNNSIQKSKNININNENSNNFKNILSKSAKKYKINDFTNNKENKDHEIKMSSTHIIDYKDKNLITNFSFQDNNDENNINNFSILNKSGTNF